MVSVQHMKYTTQPEQARPGITLIYKRRLAQNV